MGDAMLVAAAQDGEERVLVGLCIRDSARAFTGLRPPAISGDQSGIDLGGTHGNDTPGGHRLFQIHSGITFESIALDAERPPVPGLGDGTDQPGDIVVAATERLNQRAPIAALPVRSVYRDPVQAWNGFIQ